MLKVTHSHAFKLLHLKWRTHYYLLLLLLWLLFLSTHTQIHTHTVMHIQIFIAIFPFHIFFKCIFMGLLVFAWQCLGCCLLIFMASFFIFHSSCNKASKRPAYVYINLTFSYFLLSFWHKEKVIEVQLLLLCAYKSWNCRFLVATVSVIM